MNIIIILTFSKNKGILTIELESLIVLIVINNLYKDLKAIVLIYFNNTYNKL